MLIPQEERREWIQRGLLLEWFTIGWMIVEGGVALASGIRAHSLTLVAFGADSAIELLSGTVLLWRLDVELRREELFSEATERLAAKIAAALLVALSLYVAASAIVGIIFRAQQEFSLPGLVIAALAIPTMYWLSRSKLHVAGKIGSRALRADAAESIACGWLSLVVVLGLCAQLAFRVWWVDGVTSLVIVYFLVREAREAWEGEDCCDE